MQLFTETLTFTHGTPLNLAGDTAAQQAAADAAGASPVRVAKVTVEPDAANTHVSYVGDSTMALGTSVVNGVVRILATPVSGTALDKWEVDAINHAHGGNLIDLRKIFVDGTTNEQARVSYWIS